MELAANNSVTVRAVNPGRATLHLVWACAYGALLICANAVSMYRASYRVLGMVAIGAVLTALVAVAPGDGGARSAGLRRVPAAFVALFVLQVILGLHDLGSFALTGNLTLGLLSGAQVLAFAGSAAVMVYGLRGETPERIFGVISLGMSLYVAVNVVAYEMGMVGEQGGFYSTASSIDGSGAGRMIAPFGAGLNNFGTVAVMAEALVLLQLVSALAQGRFAQALTLVGLAVTNAFALYRVEMRGGFATLAVAVAWILTPRRWRVPVFWGGSLALCLAGVVYFNVWRVGWLDRFDNGSLQAVERFQGDATMLGGRVFVWEEAIRLLRHGEVGLLGVGLAKRDFGQALDAELGTTSRFQITAHSGALDLLVVYGPLLALAAVGLYVRLFRTLVRNWKSDLLATPAFLLTTGVGLVCLACGVLESFYFSPAFTGALLGCAMVARTPRVLGGARGAGSSAHPATS